MSDFFVSQQNKGDLGHCRTAVNTRSRDNMLKLSSDEPVIFVYMAFFLAIS